MHWWIMVSNNATNASEIDAPSYQHMYWQTALNEAAQALAVDASSYMYQHVHWWMASNSYRIVGILSTHRF